MGSRSIPRHQRSRWFSVWSGLKVYLIEAWCPLNYNLSAQLPCLFPNTSISWHGHTHHQKWKQDFLFQSSEKKLVSQVGNPMLIALFPRLRLVVIPADFSKSVSCHVIVQSKFTFFCTAVSRFINTSSPAPMRSDGWPVTGLVLDWRLGIGAGYLIGLL